MAWVYMLECSDGSIYTGWAKSLEQRFEKHQAGKGAKYTRARLPVKLVWATWQKSDQEARKLEARLKKFPREWKLRTIAGEGVFEPVLKTLAQVFEEEGNEGWFDL